MGVKLPGLHTSEIPPSLTLPHKLATGRATSAARLGGGKKENWLTSIVEYVMTLS